MSCKHIGNADYRVYSALASFGGMAEIRPSFPTIAERATVSIRQAKQSVSKLIEVGYVSIEQGGGRGRANVYALVKAVKGCKSCTVSKQCKKEQETVQTSTINGANSAPQKDIHKDKEKDTEQSSGDEIAQFIHLFKEINPSIGRLYGRPPQRSAAERLLKLHPLSWWEKFIPAYAQKMTERFCPKATTPTQMEEKLGQIYVYAEGLKQNFTSKPTWKVWT